MTEERRWTSEPLTARQRGSLAFLRVNTPLSLLFAVAAAMFDLMATPDLEKSFRSRPTYLTPSPEMFMAYMLAVFSFQIGFCTLAVVTQNSHTQKCIVQTTGSRLAVSNYMFALWLILRVLDTPPTLRWGMIAMSVIAVMQIINGIVLRTAYRPRWIHPFEMLLVHVPNKLYFLVVMQVLFWQQLFFAFGWERTRENGDRYLTDAYWPTVGVIVLMGVALAVWVSRTCDIFVYAASMYLDASVLAFRKMPVIGPRSRPFTLSLLMFISMLVRTLAFVVPILMGESCLTRRHEQIVHGDELPQDGQQPEHRDERNDIEQPGGERERLLGPGGAPTYGSTSQAPGAQREQAPQQADPVRGENEVSLEPSVDLPPQAKVLPGERAAKPEPPQQ